MWFLFGITSFTLSLIKDKKIRLYLKVFVINWWGNRKNTYTTIYYKIDYGDKEEWDDLEMIDCGNVLKKRMK